VAAHKVRIKDIHGGTFSFGDRPPHTITTNFGTHAEVRVCGTVVSTFVNDQETYGAISLDDGTDAIALKFWRERVPLVRSVAPGEILDVIATVGEYNGERYLTPLSYYNRDLTAWMAFHLEIAASIKRLISEGVWEHVAVTADAGDEGDTGAPYVPQRAAAPARANVWKADSGEGDIEEDSLIFDDDEITRAVLDASGEAGDTKDDIISKTSLDEIDVMLSLKELLERGDIFEVDGAYKRL